MIADRMKRNVLKLSASLALAHSIPIVPFTKYPIQASVTSGKIADCAQVNVVLMANDGPARSIV